MNKSKWIVLFAVTCLLHLDSIAQQTSLNSKTAIPVSAPSKSFNNPGYFVIKGNVKNLKESFFEFSLSTFFESATNSVKVKPDGSFEQKFPVQNRQSVYPLLNEEEPFIFTVLDKDTIYLRWDNADFKNTFSIKGKNELRTKELQLQLKLRSTLWPFINLQKELYEKRQELSDEKKFTLVNEAYNRNVQAVFDSADFFSETLDYIITGLYFQYSSILWNNQLLPGHKLKIFLDSTRSYHQFAMSGTDPYSDYRQMNENWFWNVPEYRSFIYNYIRFSVPFISNDVSITTQKLFNPTLDYYYLAQATIQYITIKDWFITKSIMDGFSYLSFADVEKAYKLFMGTCSTPFLKHMLQKYHAAISLLKPGNTAPGFSLKSETGQLVSLSNFKGKVVYIDFWGVSCGPCIYDIEKYVPHLHKHYNNKEVVFINICVDAKENEWKQALEKYQLHGVNLIAEGWANHPVCKAYNITGIPHYILVDKNGKIANNNAPRAYELNLESGNNAIDLLLK